MKLLGSMVGAVVAFLLTAVVFVTIILPGQSGAAASCTTAVTGKGPALAASAAKSAGFTGSNLVTAVAVAGAESSYSPTETYHNSNGTTDHGLWQINDVNAAALAIGDWRDPATNGRMAMMIWKAAGNSWHPWTTFNSGAYLSHLAEARTAVAALGSGAGGAGTGCDSSGKGAARPFPGGSGTVKDPTSGGFLTLATYHMLTEVWRVWGHWPAACWDQHAWNPSSDHPKGRACDFTVGTIGQFPQGAVKQHGWDLFHWLQANSTALHVKYLIYQGKFWPVGGTLRNYSGGGVYDPTDVTGGHFDHIHVSVEP